MRRRRCAATCGRSSTSERGLALRALHRTHVRRLIPPAIFPPGVYRLLVSYNRLLRCFVLVDLKLCKLTHQDLGQLQMYVNYFARS
jgi:hypothetical protein